MIRHRIEMERQGTGISTWVDLESSHRSDTIARLVIILVATIAVISAALPARAQAKKPHLPYATIDHPQFISASEATFMGPSDMLIGVTDGKTAKAYPAAILAQHGVVEDHMADGPIAVTW